MAIAVGFNIPLGKNTKTTTFVLQVTLKFMFFLKGNPQNPDKEQLNRELLPQLMREQIAGLHRTVIISIVE